MFQNKFRILIYWFLFIAARADDKFETSCNINGKKSVNYVSDKFLSISIDPAVLLAGVNLSETSLRLAKHLSPGYIRLAGPSTEFVKYSDEDVSFTHIDTTSITLTPSTWFGINEWLVLTNLTPIFGINDVETAKEKDIWNPKSLLPLLEISDKLNISCYWQLGFDSSKKTDIRYMQDLEILHNILEAFPGRNESWKIIGSDLSHISETSLESTVQQLREFVTAFMWEPFDSTEETFLENDAITKISSKSGVNIWTTTPKSLGPITFNSTLIWATQVGKSAQQGYNVIFRQPRMYELFTVTPIYWFSLLHKKLMGNNVLDMKTANAPGTFICAHCTRKQNSYVRRGAMTVMAINENEKPMTVRIKLGNGLPDKTMEVQEYILTSTGLNSTEIFLNGKPLTVDILKDKNSLNPKIRRARTPSYVPIFLPPNSIGFFVLPGARTPVCIDKEIETKLLLEEIEEDQNTLLPDELGLTLGARSLFGKNHMLEAITQHLKAEMLFDEKYYNNPTMKVRLESAKEKKNQVKEEKAMERGRKFFIDRARLSQKQRKQLDLEKRREELQKYLSRNRSRKTEENKPELKSNMEFSSKEIKGVLKERARVKAAQRNVIFTDEELDAIIKKASSKFLKPDKRSILDRDRRYINMPLLERLTNSLEKSDKIHNKGYNVVRNNVRLVRRPRDANSKLMTYKAKLQQFKNKMANKKDDLIGSVRDARENLKEKLESYRQKNIRRFRRDINMELLKVKSEGQRKKASNDEKKTFFKNHEEKVATIRKPGQTSEELLDELKLEMGSVEEVSKPVNTEVFAELASTEYEDVSLPVNPTSKKSRIFDKKSKFVPFANVEVAQPSNNRRKSKKSKVKSEEELQFLKSSEEFTDIEEGLPGIHEFFGEEFKVTNNKQNRYYRQELGEKFSDEVKNKKKKSSSKKKEDKSDELEDRKKRDLEENEDESKSNTLYATLGDLGYRRDIPIQQSEKQVEESEYADLSVEPLNKLEIFEALRKQNKLPENIPEEYKTKKVTEDLLEINDDNIENALAHQSLPLTLSKENTDESQTNANEIQTPVDSESQNGLTTLQVPDMDMIKEVNKFILQAFETTTAPVVVGEEHFDINRTEKNEEGESTTTTVEGDIVTNNDTDKQENDTRLENMSEILQDSRNEKSSFDTMDEKLSKMDSNDKINDKKLQDIEITVIRDKDNTLNENRKEKNERKEKLADLVDLYNWAHTAENFEDPRHKRERKPSTQSNSNTPNVPDVKTHEKDIKDHFKDFKQMISKDKLKFDEEKQKNRQKLLQLKKQQDDLLKKETEGILTKIHNDELARRQELIKQINIMKKKLIQKKNDIDAMLKKDLQLKQRNEDILEKTAKSTLGEFTKDLGKLLHGETNNGLTKTKTSSRSRRSLFHTMKFGNYHPLTVDLKNWRPADILALKREQFFNTDILTPPNDYQIFKSLFDQNRRFAYGRKKRNVQTLRNQNNDYLNEIDSDKFDKFPAKPYYVKKGIPTSVARKIKDNVIQKINEKKQDRENEKSSNIQKLVQNANKNMDIATSSGQFSKNETNMLKNIVSNLTMFLKTFTEQLGKYVKQFTAN